jgi:uncharacterized protein (DUF433 family)
MKLQVCPNGYVFAPKTNYGILSCEDSIEAGSHGEIRMMQLNQVVQSNPDILGGTPVFVGTRVPVQSLFDHLEGGDTLDEFLRQFLSVKREQAIAALDLARDSLLAGARPS